MHIYYVKGINTTALRASVINIFAHPIVDLWERVLSLSLAFSFFMGAKMTEDPGKEGRGRPPLA